MANEWTPEENALIVADYIDMLRHQFRGERYNKSEHNRQLQKALNGRSKQSIEFKHANISSIMLEIGFPNIHGYKRRDNYQAALRSAVVLAVSQDAALQLEAKLAVERDRFEVPQRADWDRVHVKAPSANSVQGRVYERRNSQSPVLGVNYLEREAHNAELGKAGELFTLEVEHQRLWSAGSRALANRIEHVSATRGDGLGFDIASFETDGRDRLIEVKTTSFGELVPFFASSREVEVSSARPSEFKLYRVFLFTKNPQLYVLSGSLRDTCNLSAVQFRASPR